jgi:hypothetical protein
MKYRKKIIIMQKRLNPLALAVEDLGEACAGSLGKPPLSEKQLKKQYKDIRKLAKRVARKGRTFANKLAELGWSF